MNAHGVAVERRYGRPVLSGFHAGFSLGGLLGAALGALAAAAGLDARVHLAVLAAASAAVGLVWSRRFLPAAEDAGARGEPIVVRPPRRLWTWGRWRLPACSSKAPRPIGAASTSRVSSVRRPASRPSASRRSR